MCRISSIKNTRKWKTRCVITLDNDLEYTIERTLLKQYDFDVDTLVEPSQLQRLMEEEELGAALNRALKFLETRMRSEKEVETRLDEMGFSQTAIQCTLEKLYNYKLLDDDAMAQRMVEICIQNKKMGRRAIAQQLYKSGIPAGVAQAALDSYTGEQQRETAMALAQKLIRRYEGSKNSKQKIISALQRKGYQWDDIGNVLDAMDIK